MKNILVPTDFSQNATDAAHYAAALANITGARLLLFHAYHVSVALADAADLSIDLDLENFENLNQTQIDKLAYELHLTHGISVTRIMRPGFAADEIPAIAQRLKADLVIMGLRGKGQAAGSKVGQITAAIIQESKVPVLCVPAGLSCASYPQLNFRYQVYAPALQPEPNIKQKLQNLFAPVAILPEEITAKNPQPTLSAALPEPGDKVSYLSESEEILADTFAAISTSAPIHFLIINANTYLIQDISGSTYFTNNLAEYLQTPILVLPDGT